MSRRELGSLVLVSFLLVGGFYYAKFSYLNAPDSRALLAQAPTGASGSAAPAASSQTRVNGTCIAGQSIVLNVDEKGVHAVEPVSCNPAAANTCKVTVNVEAANETATVNYCCNPVTGNCHCVEGAPATCEPIPLDPATWYTRRYQAKCAQNNTAPESIPGGMAMVSRASQLGAVGGTKLALVVPCESGKFTELLDKRPAASRPASTGPLSPPAPASTGPQTPAAPVAQAPAPARPVDTAFNRPTAATGQQTAQVQPGNPTYAQIREAGGGGTGPGQTGQQTTFPGQTQTTPTVQTNGPAFQQGGFYTPGNTNTGGLLSGSSPTGYYSPSPGPRAQTTFNNPRFSSPRNSARVASSFISGLASLVGGLFSVPANSVVNYVQSFVGGPSQQQQQTPANQNGGQQQQTNAPGQIIVVVPYPMPTSRNTVGTQLPPPPTSTRDAYAELRELARQANGATGTAVPTGEQEDRITSAFTGQEEQTRQGTVPAGNQNANGENGATPATGRQGGLALSGEQMGTSSVPAGQATSTHATSTSYKEPEVVEIGIPVDITDLGVYESMVAYLKGDWAHTERTALQNKVALAQAEVQQDAIRAQLEALQDARAANLCDDSCAASLTVLQNELPVLQSRVEALQTAVEKDAQPRPSSPPPTVAQINRVVESLAEITYEASIPRSAASAPTAVSVADQEALPEVPQTKSEAIVTRVVQSVWNFLKSIFLPPTSEAEKPRASCSLFASLFGKCK